MADQLIRLRRELLVTGLYSVHYLEMGKNDHFSGETHDYWEALYVDRNALLVTRGQETFTAQRGELLLIAPGQFHSFQCDGTRASNVMLVAFECASPVMQDLVDLRHPQFSDTVMRFLLHYCKDAFQVLADPYDHTLIRKKDVLGGTESFVSIALTEMLLTLWRYKKSPTRLTRSVLGGKNMSEQIIAYMQNHVNSKLTLKQIQEEFHISKSYIQRLFARYVRKGAMQYFIELKMNRAKELLRAREWNVTRIAEELGYDNVYHFCNQFKKQVKLSPLEYRNSIRNFPD